MSENNHVHFNMVSRVFTSEYNHLFLNQSSKTSMEIKPLRNARLEIFKTLNNLNPEDMSEIFIKYKFYILTA